VLLRESYRDEQGRSQKRTLANLSKLPRDMIDTLKAVLKGATVVGTGPQELEVERSLPHGHVAAALWNDPQDRSRPVDAERVEGSGLATLLRPDRRHDG
jgi:hypothetical protein